MLVSEAVIERLASNGIDTVFGLPGGQTIPLNEQIDGREDIRYVMARHETAVSHQAWGYAESSGRPAATLVIPGPGDLNAANGLKNALNDCNPLVHLSIETDPEIRGTDGLHETPPETYDPIVKENITVEEPEQTAAEVERAIAIAQTPPKGPVRVGIPEGFLEMDLPIVESGSYSREAMTDVPESKVARAVEILDDADAPVVLAGGGVRAADAEHELQAAAERLDAPVITTRKGKGTFPADHDLFAGTMVGGEDALLAECIEASDAALAVGTDIDATTTSRWFYEMPDDLIHVTLKTDDVGTGYGAAVGMAADAKTVLSAMDDALAGRGRERDPIDTARARTTREATTEHLAELRDVSEPPLTSVSALAAVRTALPRDAIVTSSASGVHVWADRIFDTYEPKTYVNQGSWATMGAEVPTAVGAKVANPDREVVALAGDGGLLMCMQELHTAVSEDIPITTVVLNNSDFAIISAGAEGAYRNRFDWPETPVAFTTVAEGLGATAERAETPAEIEAAVGRALERDAVSLIEVPMDPQEPQMGQWMGRDPYVEGE